MPQIAQLIGGAGTGKTRALMEIIEGAVKVLHDPHLIGFCSFTRAACDEAADRASDLFSMPRSELRQQGWFRTIHGVAHKCVGVGKELLTDNKESKKWLEEALQDDAREAVETLDADGLDVYDGTQSESGRVLRLWNAARNRLSPLRGEWESAAEYDDRTPSYEQCVETVERYEQAKRLDGRIDFVDLLGLFSGWRFRVDGAYEVQPQGEVPSLEAWVHDEMQDSSKLLDACFRRLIDQPSVRWVYLAADPYQAIFRWSGGDHRCFMEGYPVAKRRVMPRSWRCSAEILRLGEEVLRDCSDYWDRGIEPARDGGEIETALFQSNWQQEVDPRQSWLILARTNFQAARMVTRLDRSCIPWLPTKKDQGCKWKAPVRNRAIAALLNLEKGGPIDGLEWQAILKQLPSKADGVELFTHGTKSRFAAMTEAVAQEAHQWVLPTSLEELGAAPGFATLLAGGRWREYIDGADLYADAVSLWGREAVENPGIRVGTVHSAKGLEADNVLLLTTTSEPCHQAAQSDEGGDEEARVRYVAVTRAKHRLVILQERGARFGWRMPV